ncbi:hypothetical protein NHQ30_008368 [Ciborinia camelliae]|nr:hypothetical protein NHQ30_008368 [Ciborinia camelliae]
MFQLSTPTDEAPVKRTCRKSVGSKAIEEPDESPVKAKKVRSRKSVTPEAVEEQDGSAVKPAPAASEDVEEQDGLAVEPAPVTPEAVEEQDGSAVEPAPVTPEAVEEQDGSAVEPVKRRRRKSATSEVVEEPGDSAVEPVKRRRRKSATSEVVEEPGDSAVEPVKRRRRKSATSEVVEEPGDSAVEPVKRRGKKLVGVESVVENEDELATQTQTSLNTSESQLLPVEPVKRRVGRPKKLKVLDAEQDVEPVKHVEPVKRRRKIDWPTEEDILNAKLDKDSAALETASEAKDDGIDENTFIEIPRSLKRFFSKAHGRGSAMGDRSRINIINAALCGKNISFPSMNCHLVIQSR